MLGKLRGERTKLEVRQGPKPRTWKLTKMHYLILRRLINLWPEVMLKMHSLEAFAAKVLVDEGPSSDMRIPDPEADKDAGLLVEDIYSLEPQPDPENVFGSDEDGEGEGKGEDDAEGGGGYPEGEAEKEGEGGPNDEGVPEKQPEGSQEKESESNPEAEGEAEKDV